jgi:hypothetical protein
MDFPSSQTPAARPAARLAAAGFAAAALALYAWVLACDVGAVAGGSDSSGYMNHARLLASGNLHVQPRTLPGLPESSAAPYLYVPLGFRPAADGNGLVPTYPPGLPLLVLALKPLTGWRHAGDATMILHAIAGILATYALGRSLSLERPWAALGAAIVGLSPLYLYMSVQAMTDVPSLVWTTLAIVAALRSRTRPAWALAAGAAVALDVLLRPANVLAFIPVAVALGRSPRRWILLACGGLPGAAFLFAHSMAAYGRFATTGYGDVTANFAWANVPGALLQYARWLPALFTPFIILGLWLPWIASLSRRTRWLLGTWIVAYLAFYSSYRFTQEVWWYLRFILPAAPALAVAGLIGLRALLARVLAPLTRARLFAVAAVLALAGSLGVTRTLHALSVGKVELIYPELAGWMQRNVPKDAVCLTMQASGALFYYTDYTFIRWDFVDSGDLAQVESAVRKSGRPLYAVLFPFEYNGRHQPESSMPGRWTQVGEVEYVRILRRGPGAPKP